MSDDVWNDDIAYAFSTHRTFMQILGIWPLQKKTVFRVIQCNTVTFIQLSIFIFVYADFTENNSDADTSMETILYFACALGLNIKYLCILANGRKLAKNINSAIADWSAAKKDEKSYKIMKKYAIRSKMCTSFMFYSAYFCGFVYILTVISVNLKNIFLQDQMMNVSSGNVSTKDWMFIVPCGELGEKITSLQRAMIMILQTIEVLMICTMQSVADSFYINITLHLAAQLKMLETKFKMFASKPDTQINNKKQFSSLVNRHCKLIKLNQNLEDSFNLIILFQLIMVTVMLALLGLRIIFCLRNNNYFELTKSIVLLNYLFMESVVYCFGGDFVQRGSEGIFHAVYMASWFMLPATLMKDLHFAMMRSSYPLRFTGGKFFHVNRETIVYILRTAASYVSVLRIALIE